MVSTLRKHFLRCREIGRLSYMNPRCGSCEADIRKYSSLHKLSKSTYIFIHQKMLSGGRNAACQLRLGLAKATRVSKLTLRT